MSVSDRDLKSLPWPTQSQLWFSSGPFDSFHSESRHVILREFPRRFVIPIDICLIHWPFKAISVSRGEKSQECLIPAKKERKPTILGHVILAHTALLKHFRLGPIFNMHMNISCLISPPWASKKWAYYPNVLKLGYIERLWQLQFRILNKVLKIGLNNRGSVHNNRGFLFHNIPYPSILGLG